MRTRLPTQDRIAIICTAMASLLVIALVAWANLSPMTVPTTREPDASGLLAMNVAAKDVQIDECRGKKGATAEYEWAFVAPEAELFDAHGRVIGRQRTGSSWVVSDGARSAR